MSVEPTSPPPSKPTALLLWSDAEHGVRSSGRRLAELLRGEPHGLAVVEVDLAEEITSPPLLRQVASLVDQRLETRVVAGLGWPVVQQRLAGAAPEVVVTLDPVAAEAVDAWRAKGQLRAPLVGVVPGLDLDPTWAATAVDRLSVVDQTQGEAALALGLPEECVVPCGVPVCSGFTAVSPDDRAAFKARHGLAEDRPAVLVVTDGLSEDQLTGALFQLGMVAERATLVFDVARDEGAADLLRRRAELYGVQARMFGKVDQAAELWAACDVLVSRPLLYLEQRAVTLRLPLLALLPRGDAQRRRSRAYEERGVGAEVHNMATLAAQLDMLLAPGALSRAAEALGRTSRRSAGEQIARLVAQVRADADAILAEARARAQEQAAAARPASGSPAAEPAPPRGPLEIIGVPKPEPAEEGPEVARTRADLEAAEAQAGRQVTEHQQEMERWTHRAELAEERGDEELSRTARAMVERHQRSMHRALAELARLAEKRERLPRGEAQRRQVERSFQQMELDEALAELKKKMGPG